MSTRTYDRKCHELAEHFLSDNASTSMSLADEARKAESLARAIQEAVEDWFRGEEPAVIFGGAHSSTEQS